MTCYNYLKTFRDTLKLTKLGIVKAGLNYKT